MRIRNELLLQLRRERSLSQEEVASALGTDGVDVRTYRRYERGEVSVSRRADQYQLLSDLAAFFGLAGPEMLIEDDEPSPPASSPPRAAPPEGSRRPIPGGTYHPSSYVHRDEEEHDALARLEHAGTPVVIQAPQYFGKATLLGYLLDVASRERGTRVCRIDISAFEPDCLRSLDELLSAIGRALLKALQPEQAEALHRRAWTRPGNGASRLTWLLRQLLPAQARLLVALEKVDRVLEPGACPALFGLLRGWAEAGGNPPFSSLRLLVTVSSDPAALETGEHSSFFALAPPVLLGELDTAQARRLAALYGLDPAPAELATLMNLVGGRPYLLGIAFFAAATRGQPLAEVLPWLVEREGPYAYHITAIRRYLEEHRLVAAMCRVAADPGATLSLAELSKLYGKGLVVEAAVGHCRVSCALYERFLLPICGAP